MPSTYHCISGILRFPRSQYPPTRDGRINPIVNTVSSHISSTPALSLYLNRARILNGADLAVGHVVNDVFLAQREGALPPAGFRPGPLLRLIIGEDDNISVETARQFVKDEIIMCLAGTMHPPGTSLDFVFTQRCMDPPHGHGHMITMDDDVTANICKHILDTGDEERANVMVFWDGYLPCVKVIVDILPVGTELLYYKVDLCTGQIVVSLGTSWVVGTTLRNTTNATASQCPFFLFSSLLPGPHD